MALILVIVQMFSSGQTENQLSQQVRRLTERLTGKTEICHPTDIIVLNHASAVE